MIELLAVFDEFQRWSYAWINVFVAAVDSSPAPYAFGAEMIST